VDGRDGRCTGEFWECTGELGGEVIDLLLRAFVAPGEEVLVAVPTFSMYESRARIGGWGPGDRADA
jgi:hypothetical protein